MRSMGSCIYCGAMTPVEPHASIGSIQRDEWSTVVACPGPELTRLREMVEALERRLDDRDDHDREMRERAE